jgi:hypothetical protein
MIRPVRLSILSTFMALALSLPAPTLAQSVEEALRQLDDYHAVRAKTVLDLQPFRRTDRALLPGDAGGVALTALNPGVGAWFLLQRTDTAGVPRENDHLENPDPAGQSVSLENTPPAIRIAWDGGETRCYPWDGELALARDSGLPYAPLCEGRLYLRNESRGSRTSLEATAEFLRDRIWGGETIVRFVRDNFFRDGEMETGEAVAQGGAAPRTGPPPMATDAPQDERPVIGTLLDIAVKGADGGQMAIGQWYPVIGLEGVFASAFQPRAIARSVMDGPGRVNRLDGIESKATGYMIAFDMGNFDLGYAVGTDHPALGWSSRPAAQARPSGLPGPDGIASAEPLVRLGMVNPMNADKTIATFTAGFKRQHGAFKYGDMATFNMGHHYGFIENGVILSKLQPGLSTIFVLTDGAVHMRTWTEADNALLPRIRFARQNGVPLLETDPETGQGVPGDRVTLWGPGNWSGSADAELRTLRAGACMVEAEGTDYLAYGYFSTATPSAMARTFQAYGCRYAMLLDMNALEHTYLALYVPQGGQVHVAHIVPGMALVDKKAPDGSALPRFIAYPDNRDLFFLTRKEARE